MTGVFTDPAITAPLYARPERLTSRTSAHAGLRDATLDAVYETADGLVLRDFITPRLHLAEPSEVYAVAAGPAAFYKEANLHNTLVAGEPTCGKGVERGDSHGIPIMRRASRPAGRFTTP